MSDFKEWARALPQMAGFGDNVRILLRGEEFAGPTVWVVVNLLREGWELGYVRSKEPTTLVTMNEHTVESKPPQGFTVAERFGQLEPWHLVEYIKAQDRYWAYYVDDLVFMAARAVSVLQVLEGSAWAADVAAMLPDTSITPLAGRLQIEDIEAPLMRLVARELQRDDPREFVAELDWAGPESPAVSSSMILTLLPGTNASAASRMLCAALPGTAVVKASEPYRGDEDGGGVRILLERTTFDRKEWAELDCGEVNRRLALTTNDPVEHVEYGDHTMQVLVVLSYDPSDDEIAYLANDFADIRHAARAEPIWVYGQCVISLLVPTRDSHDFDFDYLVEYIKVRMRFFK
jgi:hypothetical protein